MKKKKMRLIIIAVIAVVVGALVLARTEFSVADYKDELSSQISNAEKVLGEAEKGNEEGQYSEYETAVLGKSIDAAKELLKNEDADDKELKACDKELEEAKIAFQQAANKDVVSAEEVQKIKNGKEAFSKTVEYGDKEAVWTISPEKVKKAETFNPAVKSADLYKAEIEKSEPEKELTSVAVLHNGAFPFEAQLSFEFKSELKEVSVYQYDTERGKTVKPVKGTVKDGKLTFNVTEGGIYVVTDSEFKESDVKEENTADKDEEITEKNENEKPSQDESQVSKPAAKPSERYCTVTIRCDTIADHSKITNDSVIPYVPSNGVILGVTQVKLEDGESAYDVIQRVTRDNGINMTASYSAVHDSAYIEGINNIYEFDAGPSSGWMFKVNGWFPNYGVANYIMEDGDVLELHYTCNTGKDLGAAQ